MVPGMLIAYDASGVIIATLDHLVATDEAGNLVGLVDFTAHEAAGGKLRDIWEVSGAEGSATWPEWLGGRAHDFRVELNGRRAVALVHRQSGYRRERAAIEAAIAERIAAARGEPADIRDLVGGPDRPLLLDDQGRTRPRLIVTPRVMPIISRRPKLPIVSLLEDVAPASQPPVNPEEQLQSTS